MKKISRRLVSAAAVFLLLVSRCQPVFAEEAMDFETQKQVAYDIIPETNSLTNWPQGPQVYGNSAIVMDMNSGAVLYGKKIDDQHYPASITKLMTALVALENSKMDDEVYFSDDSVAFMEYGDASIGMTPGEILSMEDALYGMLLASANEVSYAIAESTGKLLGGDYNTFIQKMNDRAKEIGCTGSNWINANGLHDDQHYTTAHDMALIGSAVYQFEEFRTITQTLNYTIGTTNLVNETRTFQQNHKMLWPGNYYYYENCTGGKTGYTDQAKTTLVTMADNGSLQLVAVLLEDQGDVYVDTKAMLDYVFNNFSKVMLGDQSKPEGISSYKDSSAYVVLPSGIEFSSLESKITISDEEETAGTVTYYYEGQNVGSADVELTAEYVSEITGKSISSDQEESAAEKAVDEGGVGSVIKTALIVIAVIIIALAAAMIYLRYCIVRRRRQRREMMARRRRRQAAERAARYEEYYARERRRSYHEAGSRGRGVPVDYRSRSTGGPGQSRGRNRYEPHTRNRDGRYR